MNLDHISLSSPLMPPAEEFEARRRRLDAVVGDVEAMLVFSARSIFYLTGCALSQTERPVVLIHIPGKEEIHTAVFVVFAADVRVQILRVLRKFDDPLVLHAVHFPQVIPEGGGGDRQRIGLLIDAAADAVHQPEKGMPLPHVPRLQRFRPEVAAV